MSEIKRSTADNPISCDIKQECSDSSKSECLSGDHDESGYKTGKWQKSEDKLLSKFVAAFGEKNWKKISEHMKNRSAIQCLHRWTKILKPGLVKGIFLI